MRSARGVTGSLAAASTTAGLPTASVPTAGLPAAGPATLVAIRAAHHTSYDRLIFEFSGRLPVHRSVRYVSKVVADPSGQVVPVSGGARLLVRFLPANGHLPDGQSSYGSARRTFALPGVLQVVRAGDSEDVLRFGVGVAKRQRFKVFTLANPSRFVIDITTPFRPAPAGDDSSGSHSAAHSGAAGKRPHGRMLNHLATLLAVLVTALQRLPQ
jgi:hypothetical protein